MDSARPLINDEISSKIIETARRLALANGGRITVRDILREMGATNRVFYNRFRNIDEVLDIIYREMTDTVRRSLSVERDENCDFFSHVMNVASRTLVLSYENKKNMSQFIFENDSYGKANYSWWDSEIKNLISTGKSEGLVKADVDEDALSYVIWCFIRGFNADAMARNLSLEEALSKFNYGFGLLLEGIKAK